MNPPLDIVLFTLPSVLFLPAIYLLLRRPKMSDSDRTKSGFYLEPASLLMVGVLLALMIAWGWLGYSHFFGR